MSETTKELFEKLIFTRNISDKIGIPPNRLRQMRNHFKAENVTINKMQEILLAAGYKVCQEEKWSKAPNKEEKARILKLRKEMETFDLDFKRFTDHELQIILRFIQTTHTAPPTHVNEFLIRVNNI